MNRIVLIAAVAAGLIACGGGAKLAPTKEAAAQALFGASQNSPSSPSAWLPTAATASVSFTSDCPNGGTVTMSVDTNAVNNSGEVTWDLGYDNCSADGKTRMSGTMKSTVSFSSNGTSTFDMVMVLKGRVNFSGEISDFVEADVTETVSLTAIDQTSGSVTIKLNGTIKTSEASHTYANETITFTAGGYTADTGA